MAVGTAVLVSLGVVAAVDVVWMGLALGALVRKLGGDPRQAWIPVLRWVAAAREGRVATVPVAVARTVEVVGALTAVVSLIVMVAADAVVPAVRIALIAGLTLWLLGSLVGWVMWIYGAGIVELR
ncbi:hypothetical protein, partial [Demequina aestuarii]|uniref:hypothetical protein n=1 Tax=Demequina aestuarii TaxID=327095 RepID=UPI0019310CAF